MNPPACSSDLRRDFYFAAENFIAATFLLEKREAFVGVEVDRGLEEFLDAGPALTGRPHLPPS
jgi:hypothetical protein